jgi:hypothetical protein
VADATVVKGFGTDQWIALGIFMLGAAMDALLIRIVYTGRIRKLRRLMDSEETYKRFKPFKKPWLLGSSERQSRDQDRLRPNRVSRGSRIKIRP